METKKLIFNGRYFLLTFVFFVEVLIAVYVHGQFIRPYFGNYLVVILVYGFVKLFLKSPYLLTAILVLLFAYGVAILQYLTSSSF